MHEGATVRSPSGAVDLEMGLPEMFFQAIFLWLEQAFLGLLGMAASFTIQLSGTY